MHHTIGITHFVDCRPSLLDDSEELSWLARELAHHVHLLTRDITLRVGNIVETLRYIDDEEAFIGDTAERIEWQLRSMVTLHRSWADTCDRLIGDIQAVRIDSDDDALREIGTVYELLRRFCVLDDGSLSHRQRLKLIGMFHYFDYVSLTLQKNRLSAEEKRQFSVIVMLVKFFMDPHSGAIGNHYLYKFENDRASEEIIASDI